jgi:hypothetical protein
MRTTSLAIPAVLCGALGLVLVSQTGCTTATKRTETLHAATMAVDTAHAAWMTFDAAHQVDIAKKCGDDAACAKALDDWRAKAAEVDKAFTAAYDAIIVANGLNDDHSLAGVFDAVRVAFTDAISLGVPL